jgi:hypothetical protein
MLSEIFILRLEAILRAPIAPGTCNSDTRFVPHRKNDEFHQAHERGRQMSHSRV